MRNLVFFFLLFVHSSFAQITFQKAYGGVQDDVFYSVQQTLDGGYVMVGYTNSFGAGGYDVYLVKTDSLGDTLWTKTYGETGSDFGYCVQQTTDSGYIITGQLGSTSTIQDRVYLIKTNSVGDTLWTKTYKPGSFNGEGTGTSVKQTMDGGYILGCSGIGINGAEFLIKTDSIGDTLWTKSHGINGSVSEIQQSVDSGYIVIGTGDDGSGFYYMYLLKTDVNGNGVWTNAYRGSSFTDWHYGYSIQQTLDGGYIAVGSAWTTSWDIYLVKTNSVGDTLWTKAYGGDTVDGGLSVYITADGGYIIAGQTISFGTGSGDGYLIKTDSMGDTLWTKAFGGTSGNGFTSVLQTLDGGFIISGTTQSFGAGGDDAYLIKTDGSGNTGCYENNTATVLKSHQTIVSPPVDTFLLGGLVVNSYPALVSHGSILNTICFNTEIGENVENEEMIIYPNPTQDKFFISLNEEPVEVNVEIYNLLGERIYFKKINIFQEMINCDTFPSGIYLVTVRTVRKIIIKKLIVK